MCHLTVLSELAADSFVNPFSTSYPARILPCAQIMGRHRMPSHTAFARVAAKLLLHEPPCMSEAEDWESSSGFLAEEHLAKPRQSTPDRLHLERTLTLQSGWWSNN
jgi:hypothetical protein